MFDTDDDLIAWLHAKSAELCDGPYFIEGVKLHCAVVRIERLQAMIARCPNCGYQFNSSDPPVASVGQLVQLDE